MNAGIAERQSLYEVETDLEAEPKGLNLQCIRVDLEAVIQGVWLFKHYARKNNKSGGKIVITSSMMGIYAFPRSPQYAAAKYGVRCSIYFGSDRADTFSQLMGLTRSCGPVFAEAGTTVNAIMPAFVATGLAAAGNIPKEASHTDEHDHQSLRYFS